MLGTRHISATDPAFRWLEVPHPFTCQRLVSRNFSPGCLLTRAQQSNEEVAMEWGMCCGDLHTAEGGRGRHGCIY